MAAARIKWSSPQELLDQISQRLALQHDGPRDLTPRQQTLRGAIDWSYELLSGAERRVFDQLAVFVGGCTAHALDAVLAPTDAVAGTGPGAAKSYGTLQALVEKSLLTYYADEFALGETGRGSRPSAGEPRYQMLETIREYAWEKLSTSGGMSTARERHARFFLQLVEEADGQLYVPAQAD